MYRYDSDQCANRCFLAHFLIDDNDPGPFTEKEATEWINNNDNEEFKCPTLVGRVFEFFTRENCGSKYCMGCHRM